MQDPNLTWACRLHFGRLEGDCQRDWHDKDDATHQGSGWWLGLDAIGCCGRNGRMQDVSNVIYAKICNTIATHEKLKKQAVVANTFFFCWICEFICTSQWLGTYNGIQMLLAFNRSASIWGPVATAYANPEEQAWEGSGDVGDASMGWFTEAFVAVVVIDISVWRFAPPSQRGELHRPGWKDLVGRSWITFRGNSYFDQNHLLSTIIHNHNNHNVIEGPHPEYHSTTHTCRYQAVIAS